MNKSTRRRSIAALLAAIGCLLLMATPATAATTTLYVHAGTLDIDIDGDPEDEIIIEVGGEDHTCADPDAPPSEFIVDDDGTTTTVEEIRIGEPKGGGVYASYFTFGGNEYQLDLALGDPNVLGFGSNHGAITGTHPNQSLTQNILLEGWISTTSDCVKGSDICHFAIEISVSGAINTTTMSVGPLNGGGAPAVDFCDSPFASLSAGEALVTGLTLDDSVPV
ncbi:MAG TPA: hypothetical protein VEW93_13510 [Acidimicrobiales bacterium]|nr:hypothetical protein [Acidimicrobiales bacterium]